MSRAKVKTRFLPLVTIMLLVSVTIATVSILVVYRISLDEEQSRLLEMVRTQAKLINAVTHLNTQFSYEDYPGGARGATLAQVRDAFGRFSGFGQTGEFVLGQRVGDNITFLLPPRHLDNVIPPIPVISAEAEPMRRALAGQSGILIGLDYRSVEVLAAYELIPKLGVGLVAKIDIEEFRASFIQASLTSGAVAFVAIILGVLLFKQVENYAPKQHSGMEFINTAQGISRREGFVYLVLVMTVVAGMVAGASVTSLYQRSFDGAQSRLSEMAVAQAVMIGSVARFGAKHKIFDHPGGAKVATLNKVRDALSQQSGFGETGEFVLGQLDGYFITFLLPSRHLENNIPPIHMTDVSAKPMQQALMGKSGVLVGLDYRDVEVVAAYEYVPELEMGLVAKLDMSEIRQPLFHAGFVSFGAAFIIIIFGALALANARPSIQVREGAKVAAFVEDKYNDPVSSSLFIFVIVLAPVIFVVDLVMPLGVAGGVLYVALVLAGWWFPKRRHIILLALISSIFTIMAYFLSPDGGVAWVVLTNRAYSLFAIWVTALIMSVGKAAEIAREKQAIDLTKLSLAVEHSPSSVLITASDGTIEYVNLKFTENTGFERHEAIGANPRLIKSGETPPEVFKDLWTTIMSGREWSGEFLNKKKNGDLYWESATILPIKSPGGEIRHLVAMQEDVTDRKKAEEELRHLATHDSLTGLPTRRIAEDRILSAVALARREKIMAAVMFIDLDGFKAINDSLGHQAGDSLLIHVGERLIESVREVDTVARIGGDEFMVVLDGIENRDNASLVAQKLIDALGAPFIIGDNVACIGASVGIAVFPDHGEDAETLLRLADGAMYVVKQKGKNNFAFAEFET